MRRFARLFMLALGLTILGLVVTLVPHKDVSAQSPTQVQVVNTPLPISGVVRAAVTNTPLPVTVRGIAVAAPLPVQGTVNANINGTPAVTLSGTPPVTISNNNPLNPLFVDPDAPATHRFLWTSCGPSATPNAFGVAGCTLLTVPTSNILVIDHVSVRAILENVHAMQYMDIGAEINADPTQVESFAFLVPAKVGTTSTTDYYAAEVQGRIYFQATTVVGCSIQITGAGASGEGIFCTLTGHLVPQP